MSSPTSPHWVTHFILCATTVELHKQQGSTVQQLRDRKSRLDKEEDTEERQQQELRDDLEELRKKYSVRINESIYQEQKRRIMGKVARSQDQLNREEDEEDEIQSALVDRAGQVFFW